jgi:ankyrin repeat protein
MLKLLESKGADYSIQSMMGFSPIHMAIENDAILSLAYFYYEKKLNFEIRTRQGYTPLLFAISIG